MDLHHKERWILSPVVNNKPVAADYAIQWEHPLAPENGMVLVHCIMNAHQFRAARQDTRLKIISSLHSADKIPDEVADHHKPHGVKRGMHISEMLGQLAKIHPSFELEH
jgi:hypothetical protein